MVSASWIQKVCLRALALSLVSAPLLYAQAALPKIVDRPAAQQAPRIPTAQKALLDSAKNLLEVGKPQEAIETLQKLTETYPDSPLLSEAYLLMGQSLSGLQKWEEANSYFRRLLEEFPTSEYVAQARLGLATGLMKTGQIDEALPLLRQAKTEVADPALKLVILRRLEEAYLAKSDYPQAVEAALESRAVAPPEDVPAIEDRVRLVLYSKAREPDLRRIAERFPHSFPGDLALLRLLEQYTSSGEDYKVTQVAREFFKRFPRHEQIETVTSFLTVQRKKIKAKDLLLGALLPLSGSLSPYGTQVLNGIKIAVDQAPPMPSGPTIGLVTKDSENNQKELLMELDDLLEDYRPIAVIGPLLSRNLKLVAPAADARDVVFFTPAATYPDVQRLGRSLFSAAINNRELVRDLAEHAIVGLGWKRLCILAPQDTYGTEMTQFFQEEIQRLGAELIATDIYDVKDTDFGPAIKRIKATDLKKYGKLEPMMKKGKQTKNYTPGFDAIFLPGDAEKVGLIAGQLHFHGMSMPILGTNASNSPELIRIGGRAVEGAVLADSFFADSQNPLVRNFVARYRVKFNETPTAFAAQAYEATQLVLDAILKGALTGRALRESLKTVKNAPGLFGPLSMSPSGYLERRYVLLQVKGGKFMAMANLP